MPTNILINLSYTVAAVLFILGLKFLGSPATARRGNLLSALGMLVAVVVTLLDQAIIDYRWIMLGMLIGSVIGALAARLVAMTTMPVTENMNERTGQQDHIRQGYSQMCKMLREKVIADPGQSQNKQAT